MKRLTKQIALLTAFYFLASSLSGLAVKAEELQDTAITAEIPDTPIPDEAPAFHAHIEYSFQGYVAKGSFTEIPSDISLIQPMYSLDGETYQDCGEPWDLYWMDFLNEEDAEGALQKLQNQICIYPNQEPLKSYLDRKLDRFYLKLRLVLKNGTAYETQAALIDRGSPQPVPEEISPEAVFAPSLAVYDRRPFCGYGKYQLTVSADTSPEEIISCLPETLPIEIKLQKDLQHITAGIVDCPVTWKPLSLPELAAGESVTIRDAAEEIVVPEGTLLNTPTGIFRLDEPLKLNEQYGLTDEVRLVLNVVSKDSEPAGALKEERTGLEVAFLLKPTGATEIQAYVWSENSSVWTSLPGLSLLDAVNEQPSTASSGYALVIGCDQEPYRSYLEDKAAGNSPTPFLIGLTIKGGIYDGRQFILPWPDTYEPPLALPKLDGSGGNEANAGAGNKNDSTPEGQRPNLPQDSDDPNDPKELPANPPQTSDDAPSQASQAANINSPSQPDTSTKTRPAHDDKFDTENQRQEQDNASRNPVSYIQQTASDLPSNTPASENPLAETAAADSKKDTQTENVMADNKKDTQNETAPGEQQLSKPATSALTSSAQSGNTDARKTSGLQTMSEQNAADKNRNTFPPLAAAAVGTAGICIAAAARRITVYKKSGWISIILQKLHYKCRTFTRR